MTLLVAPLPMHMPLEPFMSAIEKLSAALRVPNSDDGGLAVHVRAGYVFKIEEFKCRPFRVVLGGCLTGEPPEAKDAGLFRRELQAELLHPMLENAVDAFGTPLYVKHATRSSANLVRYASP